MNEQDRRVRDYYENLSLPQEKLGLLLNPKQAESGLVREQQSISSVLVRFMQRIGIPRRRWDVVVGLSMACAVFLLASMWLGTSGVQHEHTQRTFREVAMNHTTRLKPEFHGETLAMLDNSMQQLPFALTLPSSVSETFELVGSRYCSLSGELAAHVKLKDSKTGKLISLFVTSNGVALKDVRTQQTVLEGVDVELWREGGLFFALAQRS